MAGLLVAVVGDVGFLHFPQEILHLHPIDVEIAGVWEVNDQGLPPVVIRQLSNFDRIFTFPFQLVQEVLKHA